MLTAHGGIAPPIRTRSPRALTVVERAAISRGLAAGHSLRQIAQAVGRAPSTISRETRRHGGRTTYRAVTADATAWDRARRPPPCRLARCPRLRRLVARKLRLRWSPEQSAEWLRHTFPAEAGRQLSHETIYRSLYVQARGVLRRELRAASAMALGQLEDHRAAPALVALLKNDRVPEVRRAAASALGKLD